ncbi:hypothetical protein LEN26_012867 [Aphanomyces euteiches]|nr:hypothetical protein AeMF1_018619 [Aphanomyces euteiches]KAH9116697.1 hypothetical protein LEN26_012867 [Aphanomyces euteiches]
MALYKSLETDVTSFFISQGSLFESIVNSLSTRLTAVESHQQTLLKANQSLISSDSNKLLDQAIRHCTAAKQDLHAKINQKLDGIDAELSRINHALESLFQSVGRAQHTCAVNQRQQEAATSALAAQCEQMQHAITSVQSSVADFDDLGNQWKNQIACGFSETELVGLANELSTLSQVETCHDAAVNSKRAIKHILDAVSGDSLDPPVDAVADLQKCLDELNLQVRDVASDPNTPEDHLDSLAHAMTSLPQQLRRVQWSMWGTIHRVDQVCLRRNNTSETAISNALSAQIEQLQADLNKFTQRERQLELQLAACPSQEDVLHQLNALQAKLQADLSTEAALSSIDDLKAQLRGLPTNDVIQSLERALHEKADKAVVDRLEMNQQQGDAETAHLGLTKVPLKCLSCDQYLPKHQVQIHQTPTTSLAGKPAPIVSPRHVLKPLEASKRSHQTPLVRPRSSNLHGPKEHFSMHFVQDHVTRLIPPEESQAIKTKGSKASIEKPPRPQSCVPRTITLAFQLPEAPPISNSQSVTDFKKYSFYSTANPSTPNQFS